MSQTYKEKYDESKIWQDKATLMLAFHKSMKLVSHWTVKDTAKHFGVSVGLVSENLKLAEAFDTHPKVYEAESRQHALEILGKNNTPIDFDDEEE